MRILFCKVLCKFLQRTLQGCHLCIRLFYHSHSDCPLCPLLYHPVGLLRNLAHLGKFPKSIDAPVQVKGNGLNILTALQLRIKTHIPLVIPVPYGEVPKGYIVIPDSFFQFIHPNPQSLQFGFIRFNEDLGTKGAAYIHKGNLGYLLHPAGNNLPGKTAQLQELLH